MEKMESALMTLPQLAIEEMDRDGSGARRAVPLRGAGSGRQCGEGTGARATQTGAA